MSFELYPPSGHPNFSAGGEPIRFGFFFAAEPGAYLFPTADNFTVTVNEGPIPEPATWLSGLLAAYSALLVRHPRR